MNELDILCNLFILFGIYCAIGIKRDYEEYKNSDHYLEFVIYIRNVGVIVASAIVLIYQLSKYLF